MLHTIVITTTLATGLYRTKRKLPTGLYRTKTQNGRLYAIYVTQNQYFFCLDHFGVYK